VKRITMIGTALAVLGFAAAGYAAANYNSYGASNLAISKGGGSNAKPVALGMTEVQKVSAPSGQRAAPLTDIKLTIYGVKLDAGKLPVCTDAKILSNKTSSFGGCSKGSLIANGPVHALLGAASNPSATGTPCNPYLHVFNGGPKTQVFYFYTKSATDCGGLTTGATAPYDGHISYSGGNAVINVPLPPDISTKVANQPGLYSSLIGETLVYSKTVGGKVYMAGVGCKGGKRPWTMTFTDHKYSGGSETQTVKGSSKC
jgi:hypothetical protein